MKTLEITTSRPRLEITSTKAQFNISHKTRQFKSRRVPPQMKVDKQAPSFKVDWGRVWAESGRRSPERLKQHLNQMSKQNVARAIQNFVSNGNYMAQLQNYVGTKKNPIGEIAWQEMRNELPEINVAMMPESRPEITWDPGYMKIEWTTGELQIEWDKDFKPDVTITPHSVEIKLSGRSEVKISVKEDRVSQTNGKKVNKRA